MEKDMENTTSSMLLPNPAFISDNRKKKRISSQTRTEDTNNHSEIQWRSDAQQQIYSSGLLRALRHVRIGSGSASTNPRRIREAADRVLAVTAKARSRWSRAILTNRMKLKFMKKNNIVKQQRKVMTVITAAAGSNRLPKKSKISVLRLKSNGLPAFQRKARVLGRLVPGCRKESLPVVLEEATDYIAALQMQVRAMSALADLLSGGSSMDLNSGLNQLSSSQSLPS